MTNGTLQTRGCRNLAMRLSCLPVSFFADIIRGRMTVAEWARIGRAVGLDAVDLSILFVPDRSPVTAAALRRDIEAAGIRVAMLTTYPDFTHPDPIQRERELALERDAVEVAAALGAELVRVTAGQAHPATTRDKGIDWAVDGLTRLAENTRHCGVTLTYENHAKPGAWEYTDFSQPPDIFLEIAERTSQIGLAINFDTANAAAFARDPTELLRQVISRVKSVHAADTATVGALNPVLLGTGIVPFEAIFKRLKKSGFDGWICMEEASNRGQEGVEAAARYIRSEWGKA